MAFNDRLRPLDHATSMQENYYPYFCVADLHVYLSGSGIRRWCFS